MKITTMEIVAKHTMLLMVDEETLITVENFGREEYRWKAENAACADEGLKQYHARKMCEQSFRTLQEGDTWEGKSTLGLGLVWAEPYTFAHVVMDCINNA